MDKYLENIMETGNVYYMNDHRTIITDRMGLWEEQEVILAWEGDGPERKHICVSPDEAAILFEHGLISNVEKDSEDGFYIKTVYCDIRNFDGAIVCGVLSPTTELREGILEYAKRMGYILEHPTPVKMFNGTKSLTCNGSTAPQTYKITYTWSDEILGKFNMELVKIFTQKFFKTKFANSYRSDNTLFYSSPVLKIDADGFSIDNLLEKEAFSRACIDLLRVYDIQVRLLNPNINRELLLKAFMQLAFACDSCPENLRSMYKYSLKAPTLNMLLPIDSYKPVLNKESKKLRLESGKILYSFSSEYQYECYTYRLEVPYSESVRCIMKNTETLLKQFYETEGLRIEFNPFDESIYIRIYKKLSAEYREKLEKQFITLDYTISMLKKVSEINYYQMMNSILEFMASDTNFPYEQTFSNYFEILYKNVYNRK